jgi:hypothetical protein
VRGPTAPATVRFRRTSGADPVSPPPGEGGREGSGEEGRGGEGVQTGDMGNRLDRRHG